MITCLAGNFIIQTITLVLMKKLTLSYEEDAAIRHIQDLEDKIKYRNLAIGLIQSVYRF